MNKLLLKWIFHLNSENYLKLFFSDGFCQSLLGIWPLLLCMVSIFRGNVLVCTIYQKNLGMLSLNIREKFLLNIYGYCSKLKKLMRCTFLFKVVFLYSTLLLNLSYSGVKKLNKSKMDWQNLSNFLTEDFQPPNTQVLRNCALFLPRTWWNEYYKLFG